MFVRYTYEFRKSTILSAEKAKNLKLFLSRRNVTERTYFRWQKSYKEHGLQGLRDKSRKPKSHPKQLSTELNYHVLKLRSEGKGQLFISILISNDPKLKTSISKTGVRNILIRTGALVKTKKEKKKRVFKEYVKNCIKYPGQKGQIDCKYINELPNESFKRKQYTYVDLYSRFTFRKVYEGVSAENSRDFLREVIKKAPFKIECIQTDWGIEFTYSMFEGVKKEHPFENELRIRGIRRTKIPVATPRFNGSVESVHSRDQAEFYDIFKFKNGEELDQAIDERNYYWNNLRMHSSLNYQAPLIFLKKELTNA